MQRTSNPSLTTLTSGQLVTANRPLILNPLISITPITIASATTGLQQDNCEPGLAFLPAKSVFTCRFKPAKSDREWQK